MQWTPNGTAICTSSKIQDRPQIVSDGGGGAIITWSDYRNFAAAKRDIYIQKINSNGTSQWTTDGLALSTEDNDQGNIQLLSNGKGGALIVWEDAKVAFPYDHNIYLQSINATGNIQGVPEGTAITQLDNQQHFPQLINGQGHIIVVWEDQRAGLDIYAQKVIENMRPTSNHLSFINTSLYTNETIDWALTDDLGGGQYRVKANTTFGNHIIWQDWQPWTNNTPIIIQINRTETGIFNYTIEFYDMYNLYGNPNTVIVNIEEGTPSYDPGVGGGTGGSPSISFGYYYVIPLLFGIMLLVHKTRRRNHKKS